MAMTIQDYDEDQVGNWSPLGLLAAVPPPAVAVSGQRQNAS
jgi:hypothetical protein